MREVCLKESMKIILKRKVIIIIITLLAIIFSFVICKYLITPIYNASSSLIVNKVEDIEIKSEESNYSEMLFYNQFILTYSDIIRSKTVLNDAIEKSGYSIDYNTLSKMLTVKNTQGSDVIQVDVKGKNPEEIKVLSNQITTSFIEKLPEIMKWEKNVKILDYASAPTKTIFPNIIIIMIIVGFLAIIASSFVCILFDGCRKRC